jgi:hypothetical protein
MAVGVPGAPGTDTVVKRGTSFVEVRFNVSAGSYDPLVWLINPDLIPVAGVPNWYWKTVADTVVEQDAAEKAVTDAQITLNHRTVVLELVPPRAVNVAVLKKFLINSGFATPIVVTATPDPGDATLSKSVTIELPAATTSEQLATFLVYIQNVYVKAPIYVQPAGRSPNGTIWSMAPDNAGILITTPIP